MPKDSWASSKRQMEARKRSDQARYPKGSSKAKYRKLVAKSVQGKSAIDLFVMPFGIHKHRGLRFIPVDYLRWLLTQDWLRLDMRATITEFLRLSPPDETDRQSEKVSTKSSPTIASPAALRAPWEDDPVMP